MPSHTPTAHPSNAGAIPASGTPTSTNFSQYSFIPNSGEHYIKGFYQPVLTSLTSQPTVDLIAQVLQTATAKAHEFDILYTEKLRTDIELENA